MIRHLEGRWYTNIEQVIEDLDRVTGLREVRVITRNLITAKLRWERKGYPG